MANINLDAFDKIIVLDFGSQYNQLITRRIRDFGIYSELLSHKITAEEIKQINPKGIIFSGGPNSVYDEGAFTVDPAIYKLGIPILGICYGMQLMAHDLGGKVEAADDSEYGRADIEVTKDDAVMFAGLPKKEYVWMSHGDRVTAVPAGFDVVATSKNCPISAMANNAEKLYGLQFHTEVRNTEYGLDILKKFAFDVCGAKANWSMDDFIDMQVDEIRQTVGDKKVILGLSGGVDSSVTAVLIHKAIGDQLTCIFVDHGLLRKNEADSVMKALSADLGVNIIKVDAADRFLGKLKGISDPEQKRKTIGKEFVAVFDEEAKKMKDADFLAQGTLYTDVIESGTDTAQTIKSLATVLSSNKVPAAHVYGHTDSISDEAFNLQLSQERADAVSAELKKDGVSAILDATGYGESKPVAPNENADGSDNPSGRALNRRVEIFIPAF